MIQHYEQRQKNINKAQGDMYQIAMELGMCNSLSRLDIDVFIEKYANGDNWVRVW